MRNRRPFCRIFLFIVQRKLNQLALVALLLAIALLVDNAKISARNPNAERVKAEFERLTNSQEFTPISPHDGEIQGTPTPDPNNLEQPNSFDTNNSTNWQQQSPSISPSNRAEMGFVYDARRRVTVAIGGSQDPIKFSETWEYDGAAWAQKSTAHFPSGRNRPAIAYDPVRGVSVLFGGSTPDDSTFFNDTWEYDGVDWKLQSPQNPPSPRNGATMVYDPTRGRMLLFGGYRFEGKYVFFNETWEYNGVQWIQLFPTNRPSERETAAMVYDPNQNRVILFGGGRSAGTIVFNDTWSWDGANWTQLSPQASPPARWAHAITYDQGRQQIVLFGGLIGTTNAFNDTWEFNRNTWRQITVSPAPPKRWDHGMAYDTERNKTVLFGGRYYDIGHKWRNDTWTYSGPRPAPQRPVVFLPGLPGSILQGAVANDPKCSQLREIELWLNLGLLVDSLDDNHLRRLKLKGDGSTPENPCDDVKATKVLDKFQFTIFHTEHVYDYLLKHLTDNGYKVVPCAYDWRRFLNGDGTRYDIQVVVDTCIEQARDHNPNQQVDIVAHSTGGLVARQYVLSDQNRAAKVHTIVSLGTPYLGTVMAFVLMHYGDSLDPLLDLILTNDRIKEAAPNWPGVYQLLPSRTLFDVFHGYFKKKESGKPDYTDYSIYSMMQQFLTDNHNGTLATFADNFHTGAMDDWRNDGLNINYYIFVGDKIDTPRWVREWFVTKRGKVTGLLHDVVNTTSGDGTVPLESARLLGGVRAGDAKICKYPNVKHGDLPKDRDVLAALDQALLGQNPCLSTGQLSDISTPSVDIGVDSRQLVVNGPGLVHVWDNQGRHSGPISDSLVIENNIPLMTYLPGEEVTFVGLPPISAYTITVITNDTIPLDIKLRTLVAAEVLEEAISQTVSFQNIPATTGGKATISYHPLAAPDILRLMVDSNGDNIYDLTLPPTAILNKQESADYESPITDIQVQGQKDANGFFTGPVNVTLTAKDIGSGVQRIEYSLDGFNTLQEYRGPFSIIAEDVPILYAQAIDRADNVEYPLASVTLRPTTETVSGDCNGDRSVGAADITALALEFFDGDDNSNPLATSGGSYAGTPACDANGDNRIGASDITCIALIFFNGSTACRSVMVTGASVGPVLSISSHIPAAPNGQAIVPVSLQTNNSNVSSLLFSLDYDETKLSFDPTDNNQDGTPDAVTFTLPAQYVRSITFDQNDTDGELDFTITSFASPPLALTDGVLFTVMLKTLNPPTPAEAVVSFSQQPAASFGDTNGQELAGTVVSGSVLIDLVSIRLPIIMMNGQPAGESTATPVAPTATPTRGANEFPSATPTPLLPTATHTPTPIQPTPTFTPTPGQPPAAPGNLRATALDANRIQLDWQDNATSETGFAIYDGSTLVAQVAANTTTYIVVGLAPNSYHCYSLYAFNDYGKSASTDWACTNSTAPTNTPTATNMPTPTPMATATPTATGTNTQQPTATRTATPTPTNTSVAAPTATRTPTPTQTATRTSTPTKTPTATPLPPQPAVRFSSTTFSVNENAGSATITVILNAASGQSVIINYATNNGTATSGTDYGATSGTLTFAPGQTSQTFPVAIIDDSLNEADETVNVTLSNPSNATLGSPANATLTIIDSYPACPRKPEGDTDCNGHITIVDYEIWRKENFGTLTTKTADFNGDGIVDMTDFNIWQTHCCD